MIRVIALISLALLFLNGCGGDTAYEQQQADAEFLRATDLLVHGHYVQGRNLLLATLAKEKNLVRPARIAEQQQLLGNVYAEAAAFDSALYYYQQAIDTYRGLADRRAVRNVTIEIARMYRVQGDDRKAYTVLTEALRYTKLFKEEEGIRDIEWAMLSPGRALDEREEVDRILKDLTTAYAATGDPDRQAKVYYEAGLTSEQREDYQAAIERMQSAISFAEQAHDSTLSTAALVRLGMLYQTSGNIQEAFRRYTAALQKIDSLREGHRLRFELLTRIANAYLGAHQPGEADRFYRAALSSALAVGNKIGEGYSLIQLGYCTSDREAAAHNFTTARELFNSVSYTPGSIYAMRSLAGLARKENKPNDAGQMYRDAVYAYEGWLTRPAPDDLYAECERATISPAGETTYDDIIDFLLQTGRSEEAFRYVDRKNGTELFRAVGALSPRVTDASLNGTLQEAYAARALRIGAEHQLGQLLLEASMHGEAIGLVHQVLEKSGNTLKEKASSVAHTNQLLAHAVGPMGASLIEAQQALPPSATLVMYAPTARVLYALVAKRDRLVIQPTMMERGRLQAAAREYLTLLMQQAARSDSTTATMTVARRTYELSSLLYGAFIRPIERELAGAGNIYVVLPFDVSCVPLHALRSGGSYAVERYFFHYLPQAQALLLARPPSVTRDIVALGHPGLTSWDVEYELRDIRAFFKDARLYFQTQASLPTLQKEHGDLLAFAVDGRFDATSPGNSVVYLSDPSDPEITRRIPMGDLVSMGSFSSILVSELAPNRYSIHPAEPVLFSGTSGVSVVMNSYVPSRKTKKLFGELFYTGLLSGFSEDVALRQTQIAMIRQKDFSDPCVWGGWFYWGR